MIDIEGLDAWQAIQQTEMEVLSQFMALTLIEKCLVIELMCLISLMVVMTDCAND